MRVLTIEQDAAEFRGGIGAELRLYYFGREAARGAGRRLAEGDRDLAPLAQGDARAA